MANFDRDKLITAVYSATLVPDRYSEVLDTLDNLMFSDLARPIGDARAATRLKNPVMPVIDPGLIDHFKRAREIQLRVSREKPKKNEVMVLLDAAPNPAYIFDRDEKIVAANDYAKHVSEIQCITLEDCCVAPTILQSIRGFINDVRGQKLLIIPGYINENKNTNTCALVRKIDRHNNSGTRDFDSKTTDLYFLTIVNLGFDHSKTELFQNAYDLTTSEVDIAIHLAGGKQLVEIAAERGVSVATIRTQFKAIKKKTNSRDISAVVRLLCGFSAGILASSQISFATPPNSSPKRLDQIILKDGRRMGYLEQGDPKGSPVIMIHNMPYGVELPKAALVEATRMNLRIIAPYRPGYGISTLTEDTHGDDLLSGPASDIAELLDKLNIPRAAIVGHTIGSLFAMRFAKLYPERVTNLFAVARAPIWRDEWISTVPKRQRFTMRLAQYVPQLLPLIIRAAIMYIDKGHGKELAYTLCKDSPVDLKALQEDPEVMELLMRGNEEGLTQGGEAFRRDCFLSTCDFSDEAAMLQHKFHILHGDQDKIVDISQSRAFVEKVPGTVLEVVEGAGQFLFYTHWQRVLDAVYSK